MKRLFMLCIVSSCYAFDWSVIRHTRQARAAHAYSKNNFADAQKNYEQLVIDAPCDYEPLLGLANTLYAQEQYQPAVQYYRLLSEQKTLTAVQREQVLFNTGCAQVKSDQLRDALESFEAVVKLNPAHERAKKNVSILKKLLEECQQSKKRSEQSNNQPSNGKDDQQKQSKQQDKGQGQETDAKHNERQCDNADNQKNSCKDQFDQSGDSQSSQQQNQNSPHNERAQPQPTQSTHNQSPVSDPRSQSSGQQPQAQRGAPVSGCAQASLDKQSQDILREIAGVEKEGHRLYVQALAGQRAGDEEHAHAW